MARSRSSGVDTDELHRTIVDWYRRRLAEPVRPRPHRWEPVAVGPTWQQSDGRWLLPERTLGWEGLGWCGVWLQIEGGPWRFTDEQARWWLWWYAVDERGEFAYRDGVLQRLKGWGKDPVGACLCAFEAFGPCRFDHWGDDGQPVGRDVEDAWVQTAAVSLEQTKNTMRLLPGLFTPEAKRRYRLQVGKEMVHGLGDTRLIQAVTSSPSTLEGARSTFVLRNETHHWLANNDGHEMDAVIDRNVTKSKDGAARALSITNAYEPGEDSVAERARDAWGDVQAGRAVDVGVLYDSLEAHPEAPLSAAAAPEVVRSIRGDSVWLSEERIVKAILDKRNPPSRSRRFWYNQITAAEDAWVAPHEWDALVDATAVVADGDLVTLGFDGSKTDDHCALIGCRVDDGYVFTLGVWDPADHEGEAPRELIDGAVLAAKGRYDVVGFFSDLHPWESYVDKWAGDFGRSLCVKSTARHPIAWDMRGRVKEFTLEGAERVHDEILEGVQALADGREPPFRHDGNGDVRRHVHNARRRPNQWGVSIGKEHRESSRKIDAAAAVILARMCRRAYLALPKSKQRRKRSGRAAFF